MTFENRAVSVESSPMNWRFGKACATVLMTRPQLVCLLTPFCVYEMTTGLASPAGGRLNEVICTPVRTEPAGSRFMAVRLSISMNPTSLLKT